MLCDRIMGAEMFKFLKYMITAFALLVLVGAPQNSVSANNGVGVLLMHGKGATADETTPIGKLAESLKSDGFIVLAPDMPWHELRIWDKSFNESTVEIDGYVAELKSKGAKKIVVGGHSLGASAAIGYGARRKGIAGILAIAPGHVPELNGFRARVDDDWERALKLVNEGKGNETFDFKDTNQGSTSEVSAKAKDYLSWYDPAGPAVMPSNAMMLKPGTALMWIIGKQDPMLEWGHDATYAFNEAPDHPKSIYIEVPGGHRVTAQKGEDAIIKWLKGL
ncbi:MAG: alpha/beta fold hydrolase [Alphaproteobacteria bacterium]|nr:MAG: alpha/beta fold hydrolase [Alphaproteobacteria bacterium]